MSQHEDKTSGKPFNILIPGLLAFTTIAVILVYDYQSSPDRVENSLSDEQVDARIAPVGAVRTDAVPSSGDDAVEAPVVIKTVVEKPPIDAEAIYKTACFACHDTGAADAPKLQAEFWTERLPKGEEALVASSINGIGVMPPKGGRLDLSDEEVAAVVAYMIFKVQE